MKSYATLRTQRVGKRKTTAYFNLSTLNFNDMKALKGIKAPKDGKTFCLNGHRFSALQDAKIYAKVHLDAWVSGTTTDGIFTYIDVVCYERQDQN